MMGKPWVRYTATVLAIAIVVVVSLAASTVRRAQRQKAAANILESRGVVVGYDYQIQGTFVDVPAKSRQPQWKLDLFGRDLLHDVEIVEVRGGASSEKTLHMRNGDVLFPHLRDLPALWGLRLYRVAMDRVTVDHIARMDNLRFLSVYAIPSLSEAEVARIATMERLEGLELYGSGITDACVKAVAAMPRLESLRLANAAISDAAMKSIGQMSQLRDLEIMGHSSHLTDIGIASLHSLRNLETLLLQATGMSRTGLQQLHAALPQTEIDTFRVRLPQQNPPRAYIPDADAPRLELVTWIHDPPDNPRFAFDGVYWKPDGSVVPNSDPLVESLFGLGTIRRKGRKDIHPLLDFLFTHRETLIAPTATLTLYDGNGHTFASDLRPVLSTQATSQQPGWLLFEHAIYPSLNVDAPLTVNLRLEYATGRWRSVNNLNTSKFPDRLASGIHLLAAGDDSDGRAFAAVAIDSDESIEFEYAVMAIDEHGARLPPLDRPQFPRTGRRHAYKMRLEPLVFRFDRSLRGYEQLVLCRRTRTSLEIKDVSLRPGSITSPRVEAPHTAADAGLDTEY